MYIAIRFATRGSWRCFTKNGKKQKKDSEERRGMELEGVRTDLEGAEETAHFGDWRVFWRGDAVKLIGDKGGTVRCTINVGPHTVRMACMCRLQSSHVDGHVNDEEQVRLFFFFVCFLPLSCLLFMLGRGCRMVFLYCMMEVYASLWVWIILISLSLGFQARCCHFSQNVVYWYSVQMGPSFRYLIHSVSFNL